MRLALLTMSTAALLLATAAREPRAAEGGTGDVRVSFSFADGTLVTGGRLAFAGKDGKNHVWEVGKGQTVSLPAGEYQLSAGQLILSDADGATWQVQLSGSKAFKVPADGTAMLSLGKPLKIEPVVAGRKVPGGTLAVTHRLVGASGETYPLVYRTAPSQRLPPAPTVALEDSDGKTVAKGTMEYG
jgi:hypothetical protein